MGWNLRYIYFCFEIKGNVITLNPQQNVLRIAPNTLDIAVAHYHLDSTSTIESEPDNS